jgi:hypothetical protein
MKTRIQLAGGEFGSTEEALWKGSLPLISIAPGMRIVLYGNSDEDTTEAYAFSQACLEINKNADEAEQVLYVKLAPRDDSKPRTLTE